MTVLQKSYSEYTQVEKPVVMITSYEGSDEEEELKTVPIIKNNNSINIVSDFDSDSSEEDFENSEDNFFDEDIGNQVKISPQTTVNTKVARAMKKLQVLEGFKLWGFSN